MLCASLSDSDNRERFLLSYLQVKKRSLEEVERRALNNSNNCQWSTEGYVKRLVLTPHSGEWSYIFLQVVGSTLIYCSRCTNVGCVNLSTSAVDDRGLRAKAPLKSLLLANNWWLRLQWAHDERAWEANWHQAVFLDKSLFNLFDHYGRVRVIRYAGQRCLSECVIEWHSGQSSGVIVWSEITYYRRYILKRIESNRNSNRHVHEVLQPGIIPFLHGIPGDIFQLDNAYPHAAKTARDFCSAQSMQLFPWFAYSLNILPTEHV